MSTRVKNNIRSKLRETCDNNDAHLYSRSKDGLNEYDDESHKSQEDEEIYEREEEAETKGSSNCSGDDHACMPRDNSVLCDYSENVKQNVTDEKTNLLKMAKLERLQVSI